jgi:predicted transposase YdaD
MLPMGMPRCEREGRVNTHKPWDDSIKWLVRQNPQSLVSFLLPEAVFKDVVDRELQAPSVAADTLYVVTWQEVQVVLHVEFQRNRDNEMGERLWHYNALTRIHTKLPVYSVVIYLVEDSPLVQSPYVIPLPDGRPTQRLDFETIKMWEIAPELIEQGGLVGLLPLLPLTKGGKTRETVERMIENLTMAGRQDLFVVGYAFSSLVFIAEGDDEWLKARFFMQHDILRDTWVFQEIRKEGREEGLEEGKRQDILRFVELRFPTLLALAKQTVEQKMSLVQLQTMLDKLYQTMTVEEAQTALLTNEQ